MKTVLIVFTEAAMHLKVLYVLCGDQLDPRAQLRRSAAATLHKRLNSQPCRVKAKVMLQDFLGQRPHLASSKPP